MDVITSQRSSIRSRITKSHNNIGKYKELETLDLLAERAKLEQCRDTLKDLDTKYVSSKFTHDLNSAEHKKELETCLDYDFKIRQCLLYIERLDKECRNTEEKSTLLKQPTAPLPSFSHEKGGDIKKFLKEFELTTKRYNYPDRDLILLLKKQVSGSASELIESLEVDKQSYNQVKELLIKAYSNISLQKFTLIDKLLALKLNYSDNPYVFFSQITSLSTSVDLLDLKIEDFLQYCVWRDMNPKFKTSLNIVTGELYPSFDNIIDKFFDANSRYAEMSTNLTKERSVKKERASYGVSFDSHYCILCESRNHKFLQCTKYNTNISKINRLKELSRCTSCASKNHDYKHCNFQFTKKCGCGKRHFLKLCPDYKKSELNCSNIKFNDDSDNDTSHVSSSSNSKSEISAQVNVTECKRRNLGSVLPSITVTGEGKKSKTRMLIDRASECSFVTESFLKKVPFITLSNKINLTIKGFNSSQSYSSKLVEIKVRLGTDHEWKSLQFLVIPRFTMSLNSKGFGKVVNGFKKKGYQLADSFLMKNLV